MGIAMRTATLCRQTSETRIEVTVNLDGTGAYDVRTGIGFFDHMLEQLSRHSLIDLHVTHESATSTSTSTTRSRTPARARRRDRQALGDKRGIRRYGDALSPMDETLTRVALDISGRPWLVWKTAVHARSASARWIPSCSSTGSTASPRPPGSRSTSRRCTATNNHHIAESAFKGLARALREAVEIDPRKADAIPSTKGVL